MNPQPSYQIIRASNISIYARNAIENATPRMLENRETVTAPAPLDPDVDNARELVLVRVPVVPLELLFPDGVGVAVDAPDRVEPRPKRDLCIKWNSGRFGS